MGNDFTFVVGCSGNHGKIRPIPAGNVDMVVWELKKNISGYDTYLCPRVAAYILKSNENKVDIFSLDCKAMNWAEQPVNIIVYPSTGMNEIRGPENHLFGYITWDVRKSSVGLSVLDKNTLRLYYNPTNSARR